MKGFQVATGSIQGADHVKLGKNNQDALWVEQSEKCLVAVVSDGCGSCPHSEVGAVIGSRMVSASIHKSLIESKSQNGFRKDDLQCILDIAHDETSETLLKLISCTGGRLNEAIQDMFFFTIVGCFLTTEFAGTFSIGDGLLAVNGQIVNLGPFPENRPPYLIYKALFPESQHPAPISFRFQIHHFLPITEVDSILIGTDGICDFQSLSNENLPGKNETLGPLSQFWEQDLCFRNPDGIRRRLSLANNSIHKTDWKNKQIIKAKPLLRDDTTLVVIRKTFEGEM